MNPDLDTEIEAAWFAIRSARGMKTVCLTDTGRLVWGKPVKSRRLGEIGTYSRAVEFEDFRADCRDAAGQAL